MLVKINNQYINVYKYNNLYKFELTGICEPDMSYLAINNNNQYILVSGYNDEFIINIPQRKIRRQIKKFLHN
jgi:hypothetical protein